MNMVEMYYSHSGLPHIDHKIGCKVYEDVW